MYTVGSLFTGIGGIDLAFSRAGFDVRWQVEIEPFCRAILSKHAAQYWPNAVQHEDVKNVGRHNLEAVDVIFGGFPCQDISNAGTGAGIKEGTRSGLWFEFLRIISELRPRYVFLENVPAITRRGLDIVLGQLSSVGYDAEWGLVPASAVGAPHPRKRWWCVAFPDPQHIRRNSTQIESGHGQVVLWSPEGQDGTQQPAGIRSTTSLAHSNSGGLQKPKGASIGEVDEQRHPSLCEQRNGIQPFVEVARKRQSLVWTGSPPEFWSEYWASKSIVGRAINGLSRQLDTPFPAPPGRHQYLWEAPRTTSKNRQRANRLKALGNAVVPQVVQPFAEAIYSVLKEADSQAGAA